MNHQAWPPSATPHTKIAPAHSRAPGSTGTTVPTIPMAQATATSAFSHTFSHVTRARRGGTIHLPSANPDLKEHDRIKTLQTRKSRCGPPREVNVGSDEVVANSDPRMLRRPVEASELCTSAQPTLGNAKTSVRHLEVLVGQARPTSTASSAPLRSRSGTRLRRVKLQATCLRMRFTLPREPVHQRKSR